MPLVVEIAERLVAQEDLEDGIVSHPPVDWLGLAINHAAGRAMMAWIRALGRARALGADSWTGPPDPDRGRLERVIEASGVSADRARTIIASQGHFLFWLDADWWRAVVLPLFDWTAYQTRAAQSWSGYLQWGRWSDALFEAMLPFYEQTYGRLGAELPDLGHQLAGRLVGTALYAAPDPWHGGWLVRFITGADDSARATWAGHDPGRAARPRARRGGARVKQDGWRDFWSDRLTGAPRVLSEGELQAMLEWVPRLEPVLDEAVALVERAVVPLPEHASIFFQLERSGLVARRPTTVARFVRHLLKGATHLTWECQQVDALVRALVDAEADRGIPDRDLRGNGHARMPVSHRAARVALSPLLTHDGMPARGLCAPGGGFCVGTFNP